MGNDLAIKLTLTWHHRQMLRFLAERGGRSPYKFGAIVINADHLTDEQRGNIAREADQSVRDMADKLRVITMVPLIGSVETYELALTDAGRQVIEQMGLVVQVQSFKLDIKTGKEVKGI